MKKLSETYKELGIDFKFPIEIKDANGNMTYQEWSDGYCWKSEHDANGNVIYHEDSKGYKCKYKYDANGNKTYFEDNEGTIRVYLQTAMMDTELMKDKERLDWLIENASAYWVYTREDIDKAMNQPTQ